MLAVCATDRCCVDVLCAAHKVSNCSQNFPVANHDVDHSGEDDVVVVDDGDDDFDVFDDVHCRNDCSEIVPQLADERFAFQDDLPGS